MPRLRIFPRPTQGAVSALDRAPILGLLQPDLRQRLRKRLIRRRVAAGKLLYQQGEPADALYLIEMGRFRIFVSDRPGQERVLQFLGPGDVIGEAAFIAESAHVTNAVAIEDAAVWRLSRADFDALLGRHDGVLRYLARVIAERQGQANARLAAEFSPEECRALRGFVSAVYSPRGGAGVTTIALNLGIALAERQPDDVVLLDLDVLFGHALANLWLEPRGVLAQATPVALRGLDRAGLDFYLTKHASSLRILPAAHRPEEGQTVTAEHVRAVLTTLRRHFGHIVLDLPHAFNDVALTGLELADRVIVLATPEPATLKNVLEARRILTDVLGVPSNRLDYVLNHPQPYAGLPIAECAAATGTPWSEIPHGGEAPSAAGLRGQSFVDTRRGNTMARGIVALAEQIGKAAREQAALAGRSA